MEQLGGEEGEEMSETATDGSNLMSPDVDPKTGKHRCRICDNITSTRKSFNSHRRKKHGTIKNTLACPINSNCCKLPSSKSLRKHLKDRHQVNDEVKKLTFGTEQDFLHWKENIENESNSCFVRWYTATGSGRETWYCNRAGVQRSHKTGGENDNGKKSKAPAGKGSEKIGSQCPASLSLKYMTNGVIEVSAFLIHVGHEQDICFLSLSSTAHEKVKQKLKEGFAPNEIANFLRKETDVSIRDKQIRSKDVLNILRRELPDLIGYFDKNDHISIDMAVQHYAKLDKETPFFFYRPRTEDEDKFALAIQTVSQRVLLEKFSGNVICLDTTHKPCHYDGYLLGTVLILDSTGAGQPVTWFLVQSESEAEMVPIFSALKERHPNLRPKYFMSDCAESFWNAWRAVFGENGTSRLWCKWHVWRAWTRHIAKVPDLKRQRELRQMLKNLVQAPTKKDFDVTYFAFEQVMKHPSYIMVSKKKDKPSRTFGEYFHHEYVRNNRSQLWSRYGRLDCDISTNMHLESFHRTLKKRYLKRMCNRRIDFVAHILINKVAPDFADQLERMLLMRGRSSTHQQRVSSDHSKSEYLLNDPSKITEVEDGQKWRVHSSTGIGLHEVTRLNSGCEPGSCHVKCQQCQTCPHQYSCGCPRFSASGRMPCKHIHAIHSLYEASDQPDNSDEDEEVDVTLLPEPQPVAAAQVAEPELISADSAEEIEPDGLVNRIELKEQVADKRRLILIQIETLKMLIGQCDSTTELEVIQQRLQISIEKLRFTTGLESEPPANLLPIGTLLRKHKMSPQKTPSTKLLALAKRPKKKQGLSIPEKQANDRVQEKLKQLNRVLPICSVCNEERDSHDNLPEKCSSGAHWCHMNCRHICII